MISPDDKAFIGVICVYIIFITLIDYKYYVNLYINTEKIIIQYFYYFFLWHIYKIKKHYLSTSIVPKVYLNIIDNRGNVERICICYLPQVA